jgi:hypothetical protein
MCMYYVQEQKRFKHLLEPIMHPRVGPLPSPSCFERGRRHLNNLHYEQRQPQSRLNNNELMHSLRCASMGHKDDVKPEAQIVQ